MSDLRQEFEEASKQTFRFLVDEYRFKSRTKVDRQAYLVSVLYKSSAVAVDVRLELRDNGIFVYVIRLREGKVPGYYDRPRSIFPADMLVRLRAPGEPLPKQPSAWLTSEDVQPLLEAYADLLRRYGEDVLRGDVSVFGELEGLARKDVADATGDSALP